MPIKFAAVAIFFLWSLLPGCLRTTPKKPVDHFYARHDWWDPLRIPLIMPYEIILSKDLGWYMHLQTTKLSTLSVQHVVGMEVVDGKILLHSKGGTQVQDVDYDECWFIIDPALKKEEAFKTEKAFRKAMAEVGIKSKGLRHPRVVYRELYGE